MDNKEKLIKELEGAFRGPIHSLLISGKSGLMAYQADDLYDFILSVAYKSYFKGKEDEVEKTA